MSYLDSVIVIYYLADTGPFQARAARRLAALLASGSGIAISDLVRLECRVGPIKTGNARELADFETFFSSPDVQKIILTPAIFDRAAEIRARFGFATTDAIHLAAAMESGCDLFLTNDARLTRFSGLTVEILP